MTELERRFYTEQPPLPDGFDTRQDALLRKITRKEEVVMKKKFSVGLIVAFIVLLLALGVAIAAGLGVFGQLAKHGLDPRLPALESFSKTYVEQITIDPAGEFFPQVQFTMTQAHYDGQSLFVAYSLSDPTTTLEFLNPETAGDIQWEDTYQTDEIFTDWEMSLSSKDFETLQRKQREDGKVLMAVYAQFLGDGVVLPDDTYINPRSSDIQSLEDGSRVGYTEFEFPLPEAAQNQDSLTVDFRLYRRSYLYYEDATTKSFLHDYVGPWESVILPVTIHRNSENRTLAGDATFGEYSASATLTISAVDVKGECVVNAPKAWLTAWDSWNFDGDYLVDYHLYADGTLCQGRLGGVGTQDGKLTFMLQFDLSKGFSELRLRPQYSQSGDRPDEDIILK
jgi:hypothetical protein